MNPRYHELWSSSCSNSPRHHLPSCCSIHHPYFYSWSCCYQSLSMNSDPLTYWQHSFSFQLVLVLNWNTTCKNMTAIDPDILPFSRRIFRPARLCPILPLVWRSSVILTKTSKWSSIAGRYVLVTILISTTSNIIISNMDDLLFYLLTILLMTVALDQSPHMGDILTWWFPRVTPGQIQTSCLQHRSPRVKNFNFYSLAISKLNNHWKLE